jgi:Xaa-Pro aminopeptidase
LAVSEAQPASAPQTGARSAIERARSDRGSLFDRRRLQQEMHDAGVDAVLASSPPNVVYSGGVFIQTPVLPTFVLTTLTGDQAVVVNEADAHVFEATSSITDIRSFPFVGTEESEAHALGLVVELLRDYGLAGAVVALEQSSLSSSSSRRLEEHLQNATWSNAVPVFERTRMVKTASEVALLRRAAYQTDLAIGAALASMRDGDTELALAAGLQANMLRREADAISHAHVQFGVRSTVAHSLSAAVACRPGDVLHLDFGGRFLGYHSDVSRNAIVGDGTARQASLYARLFEIAQALVEMIRPGVLVSEVWQEGQRLFANHRLEHPWATLGHSVGLALHEGFEISAGVDVPIEENMVIAVEPSHIEAGDARYDIEDMVVVTAEGAERMSTFLDVDRMFQIR